MRGEIAGFVKKHAPNKRCVQLVVAVFTNAGNVVDGTQKLETTEMSDSVQTLCRLILPYAVLFFAFESGVKF